MDPDTPVSITVIEAVAETEGVEPAALEPPLYDVIETSALDALFRDASGRSGAPSLEFVYRGHVVSVSGDGDVRVTPAHPAASTVNDGLASD
ncbi:HalOD1 output domain-containing protein [Natronobiforma cellulositropha]|uniref:HalOD1 output domain-containing protein n=1 Tax=Natronobiforma cellulositropha TaxID=1679076 RepID=UPI0021D57C9E|nr:HalOD1 output domain-containing protein [Natronobiforma cellulositropha]